MGATLVGITTSEVRDNDEKDKSQQTFYAAESGISMAKDWLTKQNSYLPGSNPDGQLRFCKTSLFPTLRPGQAKALKNASGQNHIGKYNLSQLISSSGKEATRLGKFAFEYFITLTPDRNGFTNTEQKNPQGFVYYTIYSCGCDGSTSTCSSTNNNISALEAVVTIR